MRVTAIRADIAGRYLDPTTRAASPRRDVEATRYDRSQRLVTSNDGMSHGYF